MKRKFYLILNFSIISFALLVACTKASNNNIATNGFIENSWYNNIVLAEGKIFILNTLYI